MRHYRVVMKSGINLDIVACVLIDEPIQSDQMFFYQDEAKFNLAALVKREEVAGLIILSDKLGINPKKF